MKKSRLQEQYEQTRDAWLRYKRDQQARALLSLMPRPEGVLDPSGPPVSTTPLPTCREDKPTEDEQTSSPPPEDFRARALRQGREREEAARLEALVNGDWEQERKTTLYEDGAMRDYLHINQNTFLKYFRR